MNLAWGAVEAGGGALSMGLAPCGGWGRARGDVSGVRWSAWPRLATCFAASAVRAAETAEHDTSTEGEGWRSPTLWVSIVVIVSAAMGMAISKMYRERVIPMCLKFPIGQQVHSLVPV
eukprot:COSAG02_NODE_29648_length_565_cov_1.306867_1_plen_117_part_01